MIEDMSVRGFKEDTRRDYVRHVRAFAAFIGRSPDTATAEVRVPVERDHGFRWKMITQSGGT